MSQGSHKTSAHQEPHKAKAGHITSVARLFPGGPFPGGPFPGGLFPGASRIWVHFLALGHKNHLIYEIMQKQLLKFFNFDVYIEQNRK